MNIATIVGIIAGIAILAVATYFSTSTPMVFINLPGLAKLLVQSIDFRDYHVVQSIVLIMCTFVVVINLLVDLTYAWLDPRISYGGARG